jgi:hypothetical protein
VAGGTANFQHLRAAEAAAAEVGKLKRYEEVEKTKLMAGAAAEVAAMIGEVAVLH